MRGVRTCAVRCECRRDRAPRLAGRYKEGNYVVGTDRHLDSYSKALVRIPDKSYFRE